MKQLRFVLSLRFFGGVLWRLLILLSRLWYLKFLLLLLVSVATSVSREYFGFWTTASSFWCLGSNQLEACRQRPTQRSTTATVTTNAVSSVPFEFENETLTQAACPFTRLWNNFISNEILYRRTRPIVNAPSSTAGNKNKNEIGKKSSNSGTKAQRITISVYNSREQHQALVLICKP